MRTQKKRNGRKLKAHKMPEESMFYERVMPILFVTLLVVTVALILFAIGVLTGIVPWI